MNGIACPRCRRTSCPRQGLIQERLRSKGVVAMPSASETGWEAPADDVEGEGDVLEKEEDRRGEEAAVGEEGVEEALKGEEYEAVGKGRSISEGIARYAGSKPYMLIHRAYL